MPRIIPDRDIKEKRHVEDPVVVYARRKRCIVLKLNVMGQRGWPDRAFFAPNGKLGLVEFKRPGCEPTPLQKKRHADLKANGFNVEVIDRKEDGFKFIDRLCA